jgi:AcrR family transcriptional regulator
MEGRRERKKRQTRDAIAETAFRLFAERGFDHVTIADIAAEADVAVNTVFNHFKTKEDLFFSAYTPPYESLSVRLRDRAPGEGPVQVLRRMLADGFAQMESPAARPDESLKSAQFRAVMEGSPALMAKVMMAFRKRRMEELAEIAEAIASPAPPDVLARIVAGQLLAVLDGSVIEAERCRRGGEDCDDLVAVIRPAAERACDMLEAGLGDYGVRQA